MPCFLSDARRGLLLRCRQARSDCTPVQLSEWRSRIRTFHPPRFENFAARFTFRLSFWLPADRRSAPVDGSSRTAYAYGPNRPPVQILAGRKTGLPALVLRTGVTVLLFSEAAAKGPAPCAFYFRLALRWEMDAPQAWLGIQRFQITDSAKKQDAPRPAGQMYR